MKRISGIFFGVMVFGCNGFCSAADKELVQIRHNIDYIFDNIGDPDNANFVSEQASIALKNSLMRLRIILKDELPLQQFIADLQKTVKKALTEIAIIDKNIPILEAEKASALDKFKNIFKSDEKKRVLVTKGDKTRAIQAIKDARDELIRYTWELLNFKKKLRTMQQTKGALMVDVFITKLTDLIEQITEKTW